MVGISLMPANNKKSKFHSSPRIGKMLARRAQMIWFLLPGLIFGPFSAASAMEAVAVGTDLSGQVNVASGRFMPRDHLIVDLQSNVEWMRCSVGQRWEVDTCTGEHVKLNFDEIEAAIEIANNQIGPGWRLPTRSELEGILCDECYPVKIELDVFPGTLPEPYWTGETNKFATRHIWSVNFMTGHTYGRFFPYQKMLVRLVRDR